MGKMIKFRWQVATVTVWISLTVVSLNCATPLGSHRSFTPGLGLVRQHPLVLTNGPDGSLSGRAGIRDYDQLVAINSKSLESHEEMQAILRGLKVGDTVEFTVRHEKDKKGSYGEPVTLSTVISDADFHCTGNWLLYGYETWYGDKCWWIHLGLIAFGTMDWSRMTQMHGFETSIRGVTMIDIVPERIARNLGTWLLAGSKIGPFGEDPCQYPQWGFAVAAALLPTFLARMDEYQFLANLSALNLTIPRQHPSIDPRVAESYFALWPILSYSRFDDERTISVTPFNAFTWDTRWRDFDVTLAGVFSLGHEEGSLAQLGLLPLFYWHDYREWLPLLCLVEWEKGERPRVVGGVLQLIPGLRRE